MLLKPEPAVCVAMKCLAPSVDPPELFYHFWPLGCPPELLPCCASPPAFSHELFLQPCVAGFCFVPGTSVLAPSSHLGPVRTGFIWASHSYIILASKLLVSLFGYRLSLMVLLAFSFLTFIFI